MLAFESIPKSLAAQKVNQSEIETTSKQAQEAMAAKNWAAAVESLEKLARLAPGVSEVQANLGVAYYSDNRILEASKAFERALKLNPKMPQAETMLGLCYAELGRNQQAIAILASAFRHPSDNQMGRLIGLDLQRTYESLHQPQKAPAVSDGWLHADPHGPQSLFHSSRPYAH